MIKPRPSGPPSAEIYLNPGDFHFGGGNARVHTLLGSCVSITLWHPALRIGGMCHFVLPARDRPESSKLDGRYGDEAMRMFLQEIARLDTRPGEYQAKIFGGGNMFQPSGGGKTADIGERNVTQARALLRGAGFGIHAEDVRGSGHRRIIFDLNDGDVWVRHENIRVVAVESPAVALTVHD